MDDRHFVIVGKKAVYCIPVVVFDKFIKGELKFDDIDDADDIFKTVVGEWLKLMLPKRLN